MTHGHSHTMEPEADSLSYIDFEDEMPRFRPSGYGDSREWAEPKDDFRRGWHIVMAYHVASETGIQVGALCSSYALTDDPDEWKFWEAIEKRVLRAGYDVYNSDTRFEVFPAGTKEVE